MITTFAAASFGQVYRTLAMSVDVVHAVAMLAWGLGLPLLFWHGLPRLSRAYAIFAIVFVVITMASHQILGECFLTTWARMLWTAGGELREQVPFTVLVVNAVAGIRPSTRTAVLIWEIAVFATSLGVLWCWRRTRHKCLPSPAVRQQKA